MSVIAVRKYDDKIIIASDTQTTWGGYKIESNNKTDAQMSNHGKLTKVNDMIIGSAGQCSHIALFEIFAKTHKPKTATRDDVLDWFFEFKEWVRVKAAVNYAELSLSFILVIENKVFSVYSWGEVVMQNDFASVGSGMWLAIGAMEIGADPIKAVQVASKYVNTCGGGVEHLEIKTKK